MTTNLDLVDLGQATVETRLQTPSPIWYDGVSFQFFRQW